MKYKDFYSHLIAEKFEKISDLISDPSNNNKTINEILKEFTDSGGKILGQGTYATVLYHPSWRYVLKIFSDDVPYIKYVRFCIQNNRQSFPKFFDKPRRILPNFKRHKSREYLYLVKTEKLNPISKQEFLDIDFYKIYGNSERNMTNHVWKETYKKLDEIEKKYKGIKTLIDDYNFLMQSPIEFGSPDFTQGNIMKRDNGDFVLIDPFWQGETPYQTYDKLLRAEIGYDEDDNYDPDADMVKGGEKYKKKPVKYEPFKTSVKDEDDLPF